MLSIGAFVHQSRRKQEHAMAKRKATKPATAKARTAAKSPADKLDVDPWLEPDPATARTPDIFSSIEIGHVAGDIWGVLSRDGGLTISAIKKSTDAPADLVLAALGWLAREDKVEFSTQGRSVKVSLR
jgi:hypothetical protein